MEYDPAKLPPRSRGLNSISGAMSLIVILLIVQIWLLVATLDSYLAGRRAAAVPGAVVSGLIFAGCFGLYLFVRRLDRKSRQAR